MKNSEEKIKWLQDELCIPRSLKGYPLFFDAIKLCYEEPDICITKDIYYELAKKYGVSEATVESRIRTIIEFLWKNRDLSQFRFYLKGRRPSNKVFVIQVAMHLIEME